MRKFFVALVATLIMFTGGASLADPGNGNGPEDRGGEQSEHKPDKGDKGAACPEPTPNHGQPPPPGCGFTDADGDGIPDQGDNCPGTANPGQEDADEDSVGDVCEACSENVNDPDNASCPAPCPDTEENPDTDDDGICDADEECDENVDDPDNASCPAPCPDTEENPDTDNDGICDADEECDENVDDPDNASCPAPCPDTEENPDTDNDGICDADEECDENVDDSDNASCPAAPAGTCTTGGLGIVDGAGDGSDDADDTLAYGVLGTENEGGPISSQLHANEGEFQELGPVVHEGSCVIATIDNNF